MAEVVTGEAVVLDVPWARFPSRLLARALDTLIQLVLLLVLIFLLAGASFTGGLDQAAATATGLTGYVLIVVGYPVAWETATRGATPGKYALGLRVVGDDGGPLRFRQALLRGLAGLLEIWVFFGFPALLCSLLSSEGKRIGDFLAGTRVIQRRLPRQAPLTAAFAAVPPALAAWAQSLELASLSDTTAEAARQYLGRFAELTPAARDELGRHLATAVAAKVSPPPPTGISAAGYLAAVLAERNRRAQARLGTGAGGWAAPPPPYPQAQYPQYPQAQYPQYPQAQYPQAHYPQAQYPQAPQPPVPAQAAPADGEAPGQPAPGAPAGTGGFSPPL